MDWNRGERWNHGVTPNYQNSEIKKRTNVLTCAIMHGALSENHGADGAPMIPGSLRNAPGAPRGNTGHSQRAKIMETPTPHDSPGPAGYGEREE